MDEMSANQILNEYANVKHQKINKDENVLFMEAIYYLMHEKNDPGTMEWLGDIYNEQGRYDLAYKYWNKAIENGIKARIYSIGELYFQGRLGKPDYKKAYECFNKCIGLVGITDLEEELLESYRRLAKLRIADMYKDGLYVSKDYDKYVAIVRMIHSDLEPTSELRKSDGSHYEVMKRMGEITLKEYFDLQDELWALDDEIAEKGQESSNYRYAAKYNLADCIKEVAEIKEKLETMQEIIALIYESIDHDIEEVDENDDIYDLFHFLERTGKLNLVYKNRRYKIENRYRYGTMAIHFQNKWYRNLSDFFYKATLGENIPIVDLFDDIKLEAIKNE